VDALTSVVELGVGVACTALGVATVRTRPAAALRVLGAVLAVAGVVAAGHAVEALFSSVPD
jgi:hypothetical protein